MIVEEEAFKNNILILETEEDLSDLRVSLTLARDISKNESTKIIIEDLLFTLNLVKFER